MPVEQGPRINARSAMMVGLAGVIAGVGLFVLVLVLADSGSVEVQLGDEVFEAGRTERLAAEIDDRGPILFSDVAGGSRDLYLNHLGDDPVEGWVAFAAQAPGASRECFVEWDTEQEVFVDTCDEATTFPPDGDGLGRYAVYLEDDGERIVIDINEVMTTTTTAG